MLGCLEVGFKVRLAVLSFRDDDRQETHASLVVDCVDREVYELHLLQLLCRCIRHDFLF